MEQSEWLKEKVPVMSIRNSEFVTAIGKQLASQSSFISYAYWVLYRAVESDSVYEVTQR